MPRPDPISAGQRFGRLITLRRDSSNKHFRTKWKCRCDCGNTISVFNFNLSKGNTQSCGCLQVERSAASHFTHGESRRRNQKECSREYSSWGAMFQRCVNPNNPAYPRYGGRGISICKRWHKYENFLADMGRCPLGKSIDRINNDGNYDPHNCRWATATEQARNQRPRKRRRR